ncbi:hypothetical protein QBC40DRAFT_337307 [Triangularia verruculosa]|uniref:Uncharacterized protein n=1 Tax=Triangularia verruculosa TaxID=2587418 RepID=A0AAN7B0C4_9PEZI|nr:hypothetical protein QBC40DRAFT_337307 [Triangularia verruculosa]
MSFTPLKEAMIRLAQDKGQVYLIVDGLDALVEMSLGTDSLAALFELFECLLKLEAVHLLVSSRDHTGDDIDDPCLDLAQRDGGFEIIVQGRGYEADVDLMVATELSKSTWGRIRKNHPEWVDIIKNDLLTSIPRFGLVKLRLLDPQLHELLRRKDSIPSESEILDALNAIPKELDAFYDNALTRICNIRLNNAFLALQWLMCAIRPLRYTEFEELINWNQEKKKNPAFIRHSFASLVNFSKSSGPSSGETVELVFSSLKGYLVKQANKCGGLSAVHLILSKQCLDYIGQYAANPDNHNAPDKSEYNSDVKRSPRCLLHQRPLLEYAVNNWYRHVMEHLQGKQEAQSMSQPARKNPNSDGLWGWFQRLFADSGISVEKVGGGRCYRHPDLTFAQRSSAQKSVVDWVSSTKQFLDELRQNDEAARYALKNITYRGFETMAELLIEHQAPIETTVTTHTPLQAACMGEFNLLMYSLLQNPMHSVSGGKRLDLEDDGNEKAEQSRATPDPFVPWWPFIECILCRGKLGEHDGANIVRALLLAGADVDKQSKYGDTALHHATARGNIAAAVLLLQKNAEMEVWAEGPLNVSGRTTRWLDLDKPAKVPVYWPVPEKCHGTPLYWGIKMGQHDTVRLLLNHGANIRAQTRSRLRDGFAALHSDAEMVQLMVDHGLDVNEEDDHGLSPLQFAIGSNSLDVVELLLAKGANTEASTSCGRFPLMIAPTTATTKALLRNGADLHRHTYHSNIRLTALVWAASQGLHEVVRTLLEEGALFHDSLALAAYEGRIESVKVLLEFNAPVDAELRPGMTALTVAAEMGQSDIASLLLEHNASLLPRCPPFGSMLNASSYGGVDVVFEACWEQEPYMRHERDPRGRTALHFAAAGGKADIVRKLLDRGHDAKSEDFQGRNALHLAASSGSLPTVEELLEAQHGIDPAGKDRDGWNALHWAVRGGNRQIVEKLLACGSQNKSLADAQGWSPARIAIYHEHQHLLPLLGGEEPIRESGNHWWIVGCEHEGFRCDGCLIMPIRGPRFACITCRRSRVEFCFKCEQEGKALHPGHRFAERHSCQGDTRTQKIEKKGCIGLLAWETLMPHVSAHYENS